MDRIVLLDSGVIGLLCSSPTLPGVIRGHARLGDLYDLGVAVMIPDVTDYEVRRELIRTGASAKLARLDSLRDKVFTISLTFEAWAKAAEFWAVVRKAGRPTADRHALDGDAILAGVAATTGSPGDDVVIATTNVGHLSRFPGVVARRWDEIG